MRQLIDKFSPQNQQAYDGIKMGFFFILYLIICLFIYLLFYLFIYFVENKGLHKMGALVPRFTTRRNVSQRFQRYEGVRPIRQEGQRTIRARDSREFYAAIDENHRNFFNRTTFCVSKLHGFDPKFSEESFKTGLKLVGCAVKELWIFKLFHFISFKLIYSSFIYLFYLFIFHWKIENDINWYNLLSVGTIEEGWFIFMRRG